jgi:hypothetical protein
MKDNRVKAAGASADEHPVPGFDPAIRDYFSAEMVLTRRSGVCPVPRRGGAYAPGRKGLMKKHPLILIALGMLMALAGAVMSVTGGAPRADTKMIVACRERLKGQDPVTLQRCDEAAFATAMTATDADAAAHAISSANNAEIGGSTIAMFLLGLGLVLVIGGIYTVRRRPGAA